MFPPKFWTLERWSHFNKGRFREGWHCPTCLANNLRKGCGNRKHSCCIFNESLLLFHHHSFWSSTSVMPCIFELKFSINPILVKDKVNTWGRFDTGAFQHRGALRSCQASQLIDFSWSTSFPENHTKDFHIFSIDVVTCLTLPLRVCPGLPKQVGITVTWQESCCDHFHFGLKNPDFLC